MIGPHRNYLLETPNHTKQFPDQKPFLTGVLCDWEMNTEITNMCVIILGLLEAQQQHFSFCAILSVTVPHNSLGIARICLCETEYQRWVSHHVGRALTSLRRYRTIWGIAELQPPFLSIFVFFPQFCRKIWPKHVTQFFASL